MLSAPPPVVVFCSPRSRSYWMSRYLSYGGWSFDHDAARYVRSLDDVRSWLTQPYVGAVETAAAAFWRLLLSLRPDARIVVIRRPIAGIMESAAKIGIKPSIKMERHLNRYDMKLAQIAQRWPGVMAVRYADLAYEDTCAAIFEHCLATSHDHAWWERVSAVNLQINLPAMFRYEAAHAAQLRAAEATCKRRMLADLRRGHRTYDDDGVVVREESYEEAWPDAESLMAEHCVEVGEPPDSYLSKNISLFQRLADIGAWQIITARMNGRMLGYLSSFIGPSLEFTEPVCTQLSLFVSKDARGLGLHTKLQRATIDAAKARGARQIVMRAGVRGAGPKLGALYRRFGAKETGQSYILELHA
jgi:GNAT superfamily N-acetyltransferase